MEILSPYGENFTNSARNYIALIKDKPFIYKDLEGIMKKSLIIMLLFFALVGACFAQTTWEGAYGGGASNGGYSVTSTLDNNYIVTGFTSFDVWILKFDTFGDTIWTKTYSGNGYSRGHSILSTSDSGYIVAGVTYSAASDNWDIYILKLDAYGDTIWTKTYGGTVNDRAWSVYATSDGGYIISGETSSFGIGGYDIYVLKLNTDGDTLWTRTYGGIANDYSCSVEQTPDNGYIIAGRTNSFGAGNYDIYVLKLNIDGDSMWTKTFGGSHIDEGYSVSNTSDGGYIIGGGARSFSEWCCYTVYVLKINSDGDTIWTRTYDISNKCYSILPTSDDGFIIIGSTEMCTTIMDVYLLKINNEGNVIWSRTYGGSQADEGRSVAHTPDGGYIIAGYTFSFGGGYDNLYLIKTDSLGNVDWVRDIPTKPQEIELNVSPNPFNSSCRITVGDACMRPATVEIYDLRGNVVWQANLSGQNGSDPIERRRHEGQAERLWRPDETISSGIYLIRATAGNETITKRIVYLQ